MSFKIKKWGAFGTVRATDCCPGFLSSYQSGAERWEEGMTFPWRGRIVFCGYDAADSYAPVWMTFDPHTHAWEGPSPAPDFVGDTWLWHSTFYGYDRNVRYHPNYMTVFGADQGGFAAGYFYGLSRSFEWVNFFRVPGSPPPGATDVRAWLCTGYGEEAGEPAMLLSLSYRLDGLMRYELWQMTPSASRIVDSGHPWKWSIVWGSTTFGAAPVGGMYSWYVYQVPDNYPWPLQGSNIYAAPVTEDNYLTPYLHASVQGILPIPGDAYCMVTKRLATEGQTETYTALTSALGEPVEAPSLWQYIALREGVAITLDQDDLDGRVHDVAVPVASQVTYHPTWGYFVAMHPDAMQGGSSQVTVYALDPVQPAGRAVTRATIGNKALGWVGEYAIDANLRLSHILPFPDHRSPSGGSTRPPQELADHRIVSATEVFRRRGSAIECERTIRIDLTSYPYTSGDWWWTGTEDGYLDGFWELFAGREGIVVGRMPDYMFGHLNPLAQDVMYGLGLPDQNLEAVDPVPTHTLSQDKTISGTSFATALAGSLLQRRRQLVCSLQDDRFAYTESGMRIAQMPLWAARGGRIDGKSKTWTTLVNFAEVGPPGLGETNWTVWSVVPIQICRALPRGGWLVGATLYFDPWEEDEWEWTVGEREATFRNTGWHHVPAYPGFDGPFQSDTHEPILLSAYDEWTANRSLYGPDALLVYDLEGVFVECLNAETLFPPDGREILVTNGAIPQVIFRVYRWGTYSDAAEGWGQYHRFAEDVEIQAPLYACYDLMNAQGRIAPGAGTFRGFVDMHEVKEHAPQTASWRWENMAPTMYEWEYPKTQWNPPGPSYMRAGLGGRTLVPLLPGPTRVRSGRPGPGHRTRA